MSVNKAIAVIKINKHQYCVSSSWNFANGIIKSTVNPVQMIDFAKLTFSTSKGKRKVTIPTIIEVSKNANQAVLNLK